MGTNFGFPITGRPDVVEPMSPLALTPAPAILGSRDEPRADLAVRLARPTIMHAALIAVSGIFASISMTSDPMWWQLHYSQLGTFDDLSSHIFNTTLIVTGLVISSLAFPLQRTIKDALALGTITGHRSRRILPSIVAVLGACLSVAGAVPLTLNEALHERAANGMVLAFVVLLGAARLFTGGLPAWLHRLALLFTVVLVIGIALLVTGVISLMVLETVSFVVIVGWIHVFTLSLKRENRDVPAVSEKISEKSVSPIWWTGHFGGIVAPEPGAVTDSGDCRHELWHRDLRLTWAKELGSKSPLGLNLGVTPSGSPLGTGRLEGATESVRSPRRLLGEQSFEDVLGTRRNDSSVTNLDTSVTGHRVARRPRGRLHAAASRSRSGLGHPPACRRLDVWRPAELAGPANVSPPLAC